MLRTSIENRAFTMNFQIFFKIARGNLPQDAAAGTRQRWRLSLDKEWREALHRLNNTCRAGYIGHQLYLFVLSDFLMC